MKKIVLFAALTAASLSLSACGKKAEETPVAEASSAAADAMGAAADASAAATDASSAAGDAAAASSEAAKM